MKDVVELWRHPGTVLPALSMAVGSLVPAFLVAVVTPMLSGERLGESPEFVHAARGALAAIPEMAPLAGAALVQAFLFHQFALLVLMVSVIGSMSLAAHAVISEKAARTLEPLLATPLSTAELLTAKTLTPLGFALLLMWMTLAVYVTGIALFAEPGVASAFLGRRVLLLFFLVGPLITLVSLLLAVIISSRVSDARSAQQLGALVVLADHGRVRRAARRPVRAGSANPAPLRAWSRRARRDPAVDRRAGVRSGEDSDEVEIRRGAKVSKDAKAPRGDLG